MDETRDGVREQLVQWFARDIAHTGKSPSEVADAILARWDLTEKPVVTDAQLGCWADLSTQGDRTTESVGHELRGHLKRAGLTIVRTEDGHR